MSANWHDVGECFRYHRGETPLQAANRLAQHWPPRLKVAVPEITAETPVRRERWTHEQVGQHLDRMVGLCGAMAVDRPPRHDGGALVLFEVAGKVGQLDGRHRANLWRKRPGLYDVLILEL